MVNHKTLYIVLDTKSNHKILWKTHFSAPVKNVDKWQESRLCLESWWG